jgi:hypothetical protein
MTFVKTRYITTTLYALAAVVDSQFLKYSDSGGYAAADSSTAGLSGFVALESASSGYFSACLFGIMSVGHSAAINPGCPVRWSDTDKVRPSDCPQNSIGLALEGSGDTASVRTRLILFGPYGHLGVAAM